MPLLHVLILAMVQGVTEFLPVSSSGHLVLVWELFDIAHWRTAEDTDVERLILDVAVHVGTLFAVVVYFWRDIAQMVAGAARLITGRGGPGARLAWFVVVASLPLFAAGFLLKDLVTLVLRDTAVIAWATLGFGLLLYAGDRIGMTVRRVEHMTLADALVVGLAQALALVPGTSRSGITMTAARFLGFERGESARFSLLLAIPAILGAGTLAGLDLYRSGDVQLRSDAVAAAMLAFVAALVSIAVMMSWLRRASFAPFVVYRIWLGCVLLWLLYGEAVFQRLGL